VSKFRILSRCSSLFTSSCICPERICSARRSLLAEMSLSYYATNYYRWTTPWNYSAISSSSRRVSAGLKTSTHELNKKHIPRRCKGKRIFKLVLVRQIRYAYFHLGKLHPETSNTVSKKSEKSSKQKPRRSCRI
jgi:hypothetical protein